MRVKTCGLENDVVQLGKSFPISRSLKNHFHERIKRDTEGETDMRNKRDREGWR